MLFLLLLKDVLLLDIIIIIIMIFIGEYQLNLQNCHKIKKHVYVNVQYCYK